MDIARVKISYEYAAKFTPEQMEEFRAALFNHPVFGLAEQEVKVDEKGKVDHYWQEWIVDLDKITTCSGVVIVSRLKLGPALEKLGQVPPDFNEKIEVVVPSNSTLKINKVLLLEDCCTDNLQDHLDEGWRIIAACPQPQRRPDYIMGRIDSE